MECALPQRSFPKKDFDWIQEALRLAGPAVAVSVARMVNLNCPYIMPNTIECAASVAQVAHGDTVRCERLGVNAAAFGETPNNADESKWTLWR